MRLLSKISGLALLRLAESAAAQSGNARSNWDRVVGLAAGSDIRILLANGKQMRGYLQRVRPDGIAINAPTSQEFVPSAK